MKATFRVALLIDTATSWGVGLIKGISRFGRQQGNWLLPVEPRGRYERFRLPQGWEGEGVIARVNRAELADEIEASGLPAVNVPWYSFDGPQIVRCSASEDESGRMAADYFLSCGFRNFAYCGPLRRPRYTDLFAEAYAQRLADHGHACLVYPAPKGEQRTIAWNTQLASLAEWLGSLPPATALLCWSAARGRQCTEACQYAGIRVPDDIAVLGGDHDDLMASMSSPPLSTIEHPAEGIGFEAGKALQQLMEAKGVNVPSIMLSPTRVIVR